MEDDGDVPDAQLLSIDPTITNACYRLFLDQVPAGSCQLTLAGRFAKGIAVNCPPPTRRAGLGRA